MVMHLGLKFDISPSLRLASPCLKPLSPIEEAIISTAYRCFVLENPSKKIYFGDSGCEAYSKLMGLSDRVTIFPHSMRNTDENTFVVTPNRKKKLTDGTFKVVKEGWEVVVEAPHILHIRPIVIVKDKESVPSVNLFPRLYESLPPLPGIESIKTYMHRTSHILFKRFHTSERALCDLFFLGKYRPHLNFSRCMKIVLDILRASISLDDLGLLHGDLKLRNILVYYEKDSEQPFSAQETDISALTSIGAPVKEQTEWFVSPEHRFQILKNPRMTNFKENYEFFLFESPEKLIFTRSSAIATVGLVLADFGLFMNRSAIKGSSEATLIFWKVIKGLTGGFLPRNLSQSMLDFHNKLNATIVSILSSRGSIPLPTITFRDAIDRLLPLSCPPPVKMIPQPPEILPITLSTPNLRLSKIISKIIAIFHVTTQVKIYFDDEGVAYTKQMNLTGKNAPHFFLRLNSAQIIVVLDRKAKRTKLDISSSSGWLVTLTSVNEATATPIALIRTTLSKIVKPWHAETLPELPHVLTVRLSPYLTSQQCAKQFYISERYLYKLSDYFKIVPFSFPLVVTLSLSLDILRGLQALHDHGVIHGNLNPEEVLLFQENSTKPYLAKLRLSNKTTPIDSCETQIKNIQYLPPRVLQTIRRLNPFLDYKNLEHLIISRAFDTKSVLTTLDEIAMAGLLLADIGFQSRTPVNGETTLFWETVQALTGNPIPPGCQTLYFYSDSIYQTSTVALPPISIPEAITRLSGLLPK